MFAGQFELSYTDFKNYTACPYRFFLNKELRAKGIYPKAANSRKFLPGWCVHKCLELWNKLGHFKLGWMHEVEIIVNTSADGKVCFTALHPLNTAANLADTVMKLYLKNNNVTFKDGEDESTVLVEIQAGLELLEHWVFELGMAREDVESEHWFKLRLPKLNIVAKGAIDLVDRKYHDLADMKFSKSGYVDWKQLKWYDLMFSYETGKKVRRVSTFNPLQDPPLEYKEFSKQDTMELAQEVEATVADIRAGKFEPKVDCDECFNCLVGEHCPHNLYKMTA